MTATAHNETWQPIPGWPHYEVAIDGQVRSLPRFTGTRWWPGRLLKLTTPKPGPRAGGGGPRVSLSDRQRRATFYPIRYVQQQRKATT